MTPKSSLALNRLVPERKAEAVVFPANSDSRGLYAPGPGAPVPVFTGSSRYLRGFAKFPEALPRLKSLRVVNVEEPGFALLPGPGVIAASSKLRFVNRCVFDTKPTP